jgi:hypothetical protein
MKYEISNMQIDDIARVIYKNVAKDIRNQKREKPGGPTVQKEAGDTIEWLS